MKRCLLLAALAAACSSPPPPAPRPAPAAPSRGLDVSGMDASVRPGADFFAYANGGWLKRTEIPADRSGYGTSAILSELTAKRTAELIAEAAEKAPPGSDARKVGDYYASFLDEAAVEAKGLAPLRPALDRVATINDAKGLARALGEGLRADVDAFNATDFYTDHVLGLWVAQDLDDPSRYAPFLLQGGLGMPDRSYYVDDSPKLAEVRDKYRAHIAAMLKLAGVPDAEAKAKRIFDLEARLARSHATRVESVDVHKGNNHWARRDFAARAPGLDWDAFFEAAGLGRQAEFVVWQPGAATGLAAAARDTPLETWKEYLTFRAVSRAAPYLPKAFVDERFAFQGGVLAGTPKLRDRWKRAVDATSEALGEAVGRLYVERYFPASEKARAEQMVKNELAAFARRIDQLDWMAPATKQKALAKLAALKVGVGYPDRWRDYAGLEVVRGDALGNAERASLFEYRRNLAKLGRPVDRGEWVMTPQVVNAVNLPAMNAMNFPAAILQPPYFDPNRPIAMDYGAVGTTIGHEISHSFDDQGALFDATGKLSNWWTPEDAAHFRQAAARLVKQYDAYRPFPDLAVNGELTLSENIADVAGVAVAYDAYKLSLGGREAPPHGGFTGDQQFFISFAQKWRGKFREPALRQRLLTDGHSPGDYRALTVRNLDAWYAAFDVKPGEPLFLAPAERVRVW
ncbi:MAG TPA: M13 family metallopeptidase [Polyangiaceae bacterium]|nr:M13 family metallopeptidase [Polyangiaceae bacterium]